MEILQSDAVLCAEGEHMKSLCIRNNNVGFIKKHKYAISAAISWAWGTSIIAGPQIFHQKGFLVYLIWAVANSAALPVFALIAEKLNILSEYSSSAVVRIVKIVVQSFCIMIQASAIKQANQMVGLIPAKFINMFLIAIMPISCIWIMAKGFSQAVHNNLFQAAIVAIGGTVIIIFSACTHKIEMIPAKYSTQNIGWALWSIPVLFSGPIISEEHWQRLAAAKAENERHTYLYAGIMFAFYMIFVGILACSKLSQTTGVILFIVVCAVAISTLDSATAAMRNMVGRKWGTVFIIVSVILWFAFPNDVLQLWTTMGSIRAIFVIGMIVVCMRRKHEI